MQTERIKGYSVTITTIADDTSEDKVIPQQFNEVFVSKLWVNNVRQYLEERLFNEGLHSRNYEQELIESWDLAYHVDHLFGRIYITYFVFVNENVTGVTSHYTAFDHAWDRVTLGSNIKERSIEKAYEVMGRKK